MINYTTFLAATVVILTGLSAPGAEPADIRSVPHDLTPPALTDEEPGPGKRVKAVAREYQGTAVYHALYLPIDWQPGRTYPVIVEYAGNPSRAGGEDAYSGTVEACKLGYGISGGRGFIGVCLPYIAGDRKHNHRRQWWGDVAATVAYCKTVVPRVCNEYGGDPTKVFLAGFSRGAIAGNFIGLHDDEIAAQWRGFICHSHYDGVRRWGYPGDDRKSAAQRLARLKDRPQFISHEISVERTRRYLTEACPDGNFTFCAIPYRNHTDTWVLRDIPARRAAGRWLAAVVKQDPPIPDP